MVQAKPRFKNFEEYLNLESMDGLPEGRCEYVDGELVEVPPESRVNLLLARYLSVCLEQAGVPFELIYTHGFEIEVSITQRARERTRYPDLIVLRPEHLELTKRRATITVQMPPLQLIAEVVSPGQTNETRDYTAKREQYELIQVPEYWLINPTRQTVTILSLENAHYVEIGVFQGDQLIASPAFKRLQLTAQQLLNTGK